MFLTRTEHDRGINTFLLEGRLLQIEYAIKATKLGSTAIGLKTKEGVVLAVEKPSPLLDIDEQIGCAMSGLIADACPLVEHVRVESQSRPVGVSLLIAGHDENGPKLILHKPIWHILAVHCKSNRIWFRRS
uniref:Proteasome subunit alpha type-5 isoform X2 n=1 Tax=Elaeis guineensis var. tenera TaxID=51953 RepID=A0A8N4ICV0_ELAGV|nr:proteasome subunit alpha type-5 isoform X2 [Elaeis guineensis]XP_029119445.1 proteasome subunit alpha type-5 isoform X2 [Elaeis guineensis]